MRLQTRGGGLLAKAKHRLLHLLPALHRVRERLQATLGAFAKPLRLARDLEGHITSSRLGNSGGG